MWQRLERREISRLRGPAPDAESPLDALDLDAAPCLRHSPGDDPPLGYLDPVSHFRPNPAVDFGSAVDFGYWNPDKQPQNGNQPRRWG